MVVSPDENGQQLAIEEYKYVRDMLKTNIDIMEKNESLILLAMAAVYGFLIKDLKFEFGHATLSLIVPFALSLFGYLRYRALDRVIGVHNDYLQGIEARHPVFLGWTQFYRKEKEKKSTETSLRSSRDLFWRSLIGGSGAIFLLANTIPLCKN
ncbi:hypothetical protein L905_13520 [Agrobacterium sp. TS43]|uniref:hypothetical protein n=1 Tax=Agrobacterium TaxID=357 RepID=UPI0003624369|nr:MULTISPECIES: hypothetical protein [Agrobacterium]EPR22798.1 hypothetical protein L902_21505 [Agrobacterium radiobacter DSM 30147]KDR89902.1 hypothetical protein K538_00390 [Agrobacterium tumefaciens GW4]KVK46158.1 hypothetical protein L904_24065 [Agrobacterium sp. LY4]KVK46266.1 hypothetical protein L903_24040 [Agrobacterium sp. JL28]KVK59683.1 hypothetical protein L906_23635 [Agrobacterium sp. TS45]